MVLSPKIRFSAPPAELRRSRPLPAPDARKPDPGHPGTRRRSGQTSRKASQAWSRPGVTAAALAVTLSTAAQADELSITLHRVTPEGLGEEVGEVRFQDHEHGLLVEPDLHDLTRGPHGAHVHQNPDCGPARHNGEVVSAGAARGHFDPQDTGRHEGPYGDDGHLGDLPDLVVEADGTATIPVLAPRLEVADIRDRALMVHAGADRYGQHGTHAHGKGGMRMYCGVIE